MDPITQTTMCHFNLTIPTTYTGNWIRILAEDTEGNQDYYNISILADDFTVAPTAVSDATADDPIEFTITPINGLYAGTFSLSDNGAGGAFSPTNVVFAKTDWPADHTPIDGKTFLYTPNAPGHITLTVTSSLGTQDIDIWVMADAMTVDGPNYIRRGTPGTYTLIIHGPYEGTIDLSAIDQETATAVPGLTMSKTSCTFTTADYIDGETKCTFTVTVPETADTTNFIEVIATPSAGSRPLASTDKVTAVSASGYELSPTADQVVTVGTSIDFSITVNGMLVDVFNIETSGESLISPSSIAFTTSDFPTNMSKSFTVTTTKPGIEILNVHDPGTIVAHVQGAICGPV